MVGAVGREDQVQRLIIGAVLIMLNAVGLVKSPDWPKWVARGLQLELVCTGLIGWCPLYWSVRRTPRPNGLR